MERRAGFEPAIYGFAGRSLSPLGHRRRLISYLSGNAPISRADDRTRTGDFHLGKVTLYQLSYIRLSEYSIT